MLNSWTASFLACAPPWKRAGAFAAAYCSEQRGLASPLHVCVCLITLDALQSPLLQLYLDPTQRLRRQWFGCCDLQLIPWLLNFMQSHLRSIKLHTQSVFQKGVCLSAKTGERENPLSVYSPWELASCSPLKLRLPEFLASASTSCLLKNLSYFCIIHVAWACYKVSSHPHLSSFWHIAWLTPVSLSLKGRGFWLVDYLHSSFFFFFFFFPLSPFFCFWAGYGEMLYI